MTPRKKKREFQLVEIDAFDARRGYKRCSLPGVDCSFERNSEYPRYKTSADFWRDPAGQLVVRFSTSQPWVFHYQATLANGKPIPERAIENFGHYIMDLLSEWDMIDISPIDEPWP